MSFEMKVCPSKHVVLVLWLQFHGLVEIAQSQFGASLPRLLVGTERIEFGLVREHPDKDVDLCPGFVKVSGLEKHDGLSQQRHILLRIDSQRLVEIVIRLGKADGWYKVKLSNGEKGYVRCDLVNWSAISL